MQSVAVGAGAGGGWGGLGSDHRGEGALLFNCEDDREGKGKEGGREGEHAVSSAREGEGS